jgi:hypothetical protein
LDTKPARIETGVSQLRGLLWNPVTQESHFAILDDGDANGNRKLAEAMTYWTHKRTPIGWDFEKFEDDGNCDYIDPLRYAMAPWIEDLKVIMRASQPKSEFEEEVAAKMGDKDAIEKQKLKEDAQKQMSDHFAEGFGFVGVFSQEKALEKAKLTADGQRGWTPLKANPDQFIEKKKDPNKAEPLGNKPKSVISFRF